MSGSAKRYRELTEGEIQVLSTVGVSVVTTAISVVNKLAVAAFPYHSTLSFVQTVFILLGMFLLLAFGSHSQNALSWKKALIFFPTALATCANFVTNFKALDKVNVSTLAVMHNVNLLLVACLDVILFGRSFKPKTIISLCVLTAGAVMYCYGEIQVSVVGYFWIFLHLIAHESQSMYTKYITVVNNFSAYEMSLYNSLWSCPILFMAILLTENVSEAFDALFSPDSFWVVVSGVCAMLLSNLRFFTLKNLTVTAYAALNIVNKVPASIIGVFLFHQQVTLIQVIGYVVAFAGSWMYAVYGQEDEFNEAKAILKKPSASATSTSSSPATATSSSDTTAEAAEPTPITLEQGGVNEVPKAEFSLSYLTSTFNALLHTISSSISP